MPYNRRKRKQHLLIFYLFLIVFIFAASFMNSGTVLRYRYPLKYSNHIYSYSRQNNLDPMLVAAVIFVESRFKPDAVSPKGARGLMQIMPETGRWAAEKTGVENFSEDRLFEPELNIRIGTWYLAALMEEYGGNLNLVMAAYNGGRGNVNQWLKTNTVNTDGENIENIPFSETRMYVKKINSVYEIYKKIY